MGSKPAVEARYAERAGTVGDDLDELGAAIDRGRAVVTRDPGRGTVREQAGVDRTAALLAVEVRAVAARRGARARRRARRARSRTSRSRTPRTSSSRRRETPPSTAPLSQRSRRALSTPCSRQIASMFAVLPPATHDHVRGGDLLRRPLGNAEGEGDVRRARPRAPGALEGLDGAIGIACRRRQEHDVRLRDARELEHEIVERGRGIAAEKAAATHRHDVPVHARHPRTTRRRESQRPRAAYPSALFSGPASCARITQMRYVYDFDEQAPGGRELLGGKGVGLAEMTALGVPVPAGFTITTDACRAYMAGGKQVPDGPRRRGRRAHRRARGALGQALRRPVRPAARLGPLGRGDLDAGDDGHDPQPRPHRRRGRGPGGVDREPAVRATTRTGG